MFVQLHCGPDLLLGLGELLVGDLQHLRRIAASAHHSLLRDDCCDIRLWD